VHVGVKEAVAEHLGEEDLDPGARKRRDVHAPGAQLGDLRNGRAVHALHDHHAPRAMIPVHAGHREERRILEVSPQLRRVRRLAQQVELVLEVLGELGDHLAGLEPAALGP